jgi:hypothetical protein
MFKWQMDKFEGVQLSERYLFYIPIIDLLVLHAPLAFPTFLIPPISINTL